MSEPVDVDRLLALMDVAMGRTKLLIGDHMIESFTAEDTFSHEATMYVLPAIDEAQTLYKQYRKHNE